MWKVAMDFVAGIFKPAADLIDNVHTSEEEKLELRNVLENGVKSTIDPCQIKCYILQHVTST